MSWLSVAHAVPAIGIGLDPVPIAAVEYLAALRPFLRTVHPTAHDEQQLQCDLSSGAPLALKLHGDGSGLTYAVEQAKAYVNFQHPNNIQLVPGGVGKVDTPTVGMLYDELMEQLRPQALAFFDRVLSVGRQNVHRVGIVANVHLDPKSLPPGISDFLTAIPAPGGSHAASDVRVTVDLSAKPGSIQRCIIRCQHDETSSPSVFVQLDWQQTYLEPRMLSSSALAKAVEAAIVLARSYFDDFGVGGQDDDDLD